MRLGQQVRYELSVIEAYEQAHTQTVATSSRPACSAEAPSAAERLESWRQALREFAVETGLDESKLLSIEDAQLVQLERWRGLTTVLLSVTLPTVEPREAEEAC